jgi:hypothetical protein
MFSCLPRFRQARLNFEAGFTGLFCLISGAFSQTSVDNIAGAGIIGVHPESARSAITRFGQRGDTHAGTTER